MEEMEQVLKRMVIPRLHAIERQFDAIDNELGDLMKRVDSIETNLCEFRRTLGWHKEAGEHPRASVSASPVAPGRAE